MKVWFSTAAEDQLDRLPAFLQKRILSKIELYAAQPDPLQFAEPLSASDFYRFRIGDHRVIFEVLHGTIWILAIKRRNEAYR
jgi:mRNA-degrading endonuclease RelE of RelBE toxin-antitoxin system